MEEMDKIKGMILFKEVLEEFMKENLTDEEYIVLNGRFGLEDGKPKSSEEVANILNVIVAKIRMIGAKALRKFKSNMNELEKLSNDRGINLEEFKELGNNMFDMNGMGTSDNSKTGMKR